MKEKQYTIDSEIELCLDKIEDKYERKELISIRFKSLRIISREVIGYKPKSKIRNEESLLVTYLKLLIEKDVENFTKEDIIKFENRYILPIVNKFSNKGYRIKNSWVLASLFFVPLDIILYLLGVSEFYLYIPLMTIIFVFGMLKSEVKAKKRNKLW